MIPYFRFVSVLFFSLTSFLCFAQDNKEIDSLLAQGDRYLYVDWDSSKMFLQQAETLALESQNEKDMGRVANMLGSLHYVGGNYAESMRNFSKANDIFNRNPDKKELAYALNGRGLIYLSQHDYARAIEIWERCIPLNRELGDDYGLGKSYFNKSIAEMELKQYQKADESLTTALNLLEKFKEKPLYAMALNRFAKINFELNDLVKAEEFYTRVLNIKPEVTTWEKTFANTGLAEIYLVRENPGKALQYGLIAEQLAEKAKAFWDKERATKVIAIAYENLGDYGNALKYTKLNKAYSDSLYSENKNSEISYLQLQLTAADNLNLLREKEIAEQEAAFNSKLAITLIIALIVTIVGFLLYARLLKQKEEINTQLEAKQTEIENQNQKLEAINEEKNKLFSILSHDLKSPINSVKQLLEIEEKGFLSESESQKVRKMLIRQVTETDEMLSKLLRWSHAQLDGILTNRVETQLAPMLQDQIGHMEYQTSNKNIQIDSTGLKSPEMVLVDPQQISIIFQNCLHNAIKFSEPNSQIKVWLSDEEETYQKLHIKDFGIGIDAEKLAEIQSQQVRVKSTDGTLKEKGTGLGLQLVKQFMDKNQGIFEIKSEVGKGTEIILSFEKIKRETPSNQLTS
ncbi:ATP-binding protein [Algoriphagus ornithinivorans]|nr:tetratricopeptide repeat-containing sensor histidine kinase [Algoriphagus ornithinivorans]